MSVQSQTVFSYTNSNTTINSNADKDSFNDQQIYTQNILDGLGRDIESRQYEGGTCYISVQRTYDALGRAYGVSNPFRCW